MKYRILVVEDDPRILPVLVEFCEAAGHIVETVGDGAAGLRQACSKPFDVLVLDVGLPGLSGPAICQAVRHEGYRGVILIITGVSNISDGPEGLRMGADDYLVRPFDPAEMVMRVNTLLEHHGKK